MTSTDCKNILIAEDTRINQKVFQRIVLKCGHAPTIKENGQEALNIYNIEHFDLIITDIMMPIMDGIQLIKNVRSLSDERANVYIIAASADSSDTNRQACLDAGANIFVAKPINSKTFSDLIHQAFQEQNLAPITQQESYTPQVNMSIIEDIAEDDTELLLEISESILMAFKDDLHSFKEAMIVKDFSSIVMKVHRIKGNLSQIGEATLTKLATKIEDFAKDQDIDSIQKVSKEFSESVVAVQKYLESYLASK